MSYGMAFSKMCNGCWQENVACLLRYFKTVSNISSSMITRYYYTLYFLFQLVRPFSP